MSASKPRGRNWTHQEDEALCRAWLDVSQDPIIGTNQKAENLYGRVYEKFVEICAEIGTALPEQRAATGIKGRWHSISKSVGKFAGCISQVNSHQQSGSSPEDNLKKALTLYAAKEKSPFLLMHCYRILGSAPKWQQYHVKSPAKRTIQQISNDTVEEFSFNEEGESSNQIHTGNGRPKGRNASKLQKAAGTETLQLAKAGRLLAEAANKKAEDSVERTKALKRIANHSIMSVDFSGLNAVAQEYYKLEQRRILSETYEKACREIDVAESSVAPASACSALSEEGHSQRLDSNESCEETNETSENNLIQEFLDS